MLLWMFFLFPLSSPGSSRNTPSTTRERTTRVVQEDATFVCVCLQFHWRKRHESSLLISPNFLPSVRQEWGTRGPESQTTREENHHHHNSNTSKGGGISACDMGARSACLSSSVLMLLCESVDPQQSTLWMVMPIARCFQGRNCRLHAALWQHDDRNYIDYIVVLCSEKYMVTKV